MTRTAWILGGTLSAPTLLAMNRWEQLVSEGQVLGATRPLLNETQRAITARVADLILPRTDTPGALDTGVPDFIELMIRDCYKKPAQDTFLTGLGELERSNFLTLSPEQQTTALQQIETQSKKATDVTFWQMIKEQTLLGYYTSEAGVKASFDYQPIPGKFEAIKIKPGQKDFMYGNQA